MIKVLYKCWCMKEEASVDVPERPAKGDLMLWMNVVTATLGLDHNTRSPHCMAETIEYAKIPVDENAEGVGMKPKLSS